ncbi:MAG: benzoyl-CoA reductase subunit D [Deltaproteobacteria bacterium]|nr:benzoyl-CoA reductase subunit D [Deltaproteobacteria bacterium]
MITAGIDVGSSSIKIAVMKEGELIYHHSEKLRRREPLKVITQAYSLTLKELDLKEEEIKYVATTGEAETVEFRTGHFYTMTTHARGGLFLNPEARAVVDVGALHARAVQIDERAKVLNYRMTSQCASGSGQFLENISRYLGISIEEIGSISLTSKKPEPCSSICAVLAETDAINMVSRGIKTPDIVKGIHLSIAGRLIKLLRASRAKGVVILTGGLSQDIGLVAALIELAGIDELKSGDRTYEFKTHPLGAFAGAIGAALWGAFRYEKVYRKIVA